MPELSHKERLQPSLLDRLTDDEPEVRVESRDKRVLSQEKLRASVLRDLTWLFNTTQLSALIDLC
jgi:type VI secretion system protein ImpF